MKFNKVEVKLAVDVDIMQTEGSVVLPAASNYGICGEPTEVKRLVSIIQRARQGSADACIELLEYGQRESPRKARE